MKKKKLTGAVFIMIIKNSQLYFIYLFFFFFAQAFDLFYKNCFQGNCYNKSRKTYAQD